MKRRSFFLLRVFNESLGIKLIVFFQTRLSKILLVKKECIEKLRDMNTQAEKMVLQSFCFHCVLRLLITGTYF